MITYEPYVNLSGVALRTLRPSLPIWKKKHFCIGSTIESLSAYSYRILISVKWKYSSLLYLAYGDLLPIRRRWYRPRICHPGRFFFSFISLALHPSLHSVTSTPFFLHAVINTVRISAQMDSVSRALQLCNRIAYRLFLNLHKILSSLYTFQFRHDIINSQRQHEHCPLQRLKVYQERATY